MCVRCHILKRSVVPNIFVVCQPLGYYALCPLDALSHCVITVMCRAGVPLERYWLCDVRQWRKPLLIVALPRYISAFWLARCDDLLLGITHLIHQCVLYMKRKSPLDLWLGGGIPLNPNLPYSLLDHR